MKKLTTYLKTPQAKEVIREKTGISEYSTRHRYPIDHLAAELWRKTSEKLNNSRKDWVEIQLAKPSE